MKGLIQNWTDKLEYITEYKLICENTEITGSRKLKELNDRINYALEIADCDNKISEPLKEHLCSMIEYKKSCLLKIKIDKLEGKLEKFHTSEQWTLRYRMAWYYDNNQEYDKSGELFAQLKKELEGNLKYAIENKDKKAATSYEKELEKIQLKIEANNLYKNAYVAHKLALEKYDAIDPNDEIDQHKEKAEESINNFTVAKNNLTEALSKLKSAENLEDEELVFLVRNNVAAIKSFIEKIEEQIKEVSEQVFENKDKIYYGNSGFILLENRKKYVTAKNKNEEYYVSEFKHNM